MSPRVPSRSDFAMAVDRQLARYRAMRDFAVTAEPRGTAGRSGKATDTLPFVVQKHSARQLHYDFRLGWHGVLKSWAVAKGPSCVYGDKRLAVEVEDHPMEYGGFEGTIPKGMYGGGTVMVWDFGEWQPLGDVDKQLAEGNLKFALKGTKLRGKWALVRMRPNPKRDRSGKPSWLLLKEHDEWVQPESAAAITELASDSALTQRSMEEIAASADHVWKPGLGLQSDADDRNRKEPAPKEKPPARAAKPYDRLLRELPMEEFPGFIAPQLAEEARAVPTDSNWVHELKLDGYRLQMHVQRHPISGVSAAQVRLFTRKGLDWTPRMPALARSAAELQLDSAILDGEVVVLDESGRSSFADLQAAFQSGRNADLIYFAFDLLHLDGRNVRGLPLLKRKEILEKVLPPRDISLPVRFCEHIEASGDVVFRKACELGAEGIVSKLVSAPYNPGRGSTWLKKKGSSKQEFVIGGFTTVAKTDRGIGALLLGYYDGDRLLYAGRCGTGFSHEMERALRLRLDALVQKVSAFHELPREAKERAHWVKPELVAQVAFSTWTRDDLIRQSSFKGLREDKSPKEIVRERTIAENAELVPSLDGVIKPALKRREAAPTRTPVALPITRPNKVLDEASGMTKQQLAQYYLEVAQHMLPHVAGRPLSVVRCPDGIGKQMFFQKHISAGLPSGVNTVSAPNKKTGKSEQFLTIDSSEGLLGLAQLGVLEIHPWGSKNAAADKPDRIIFDLDPDEAITWPTLARAAQELRSRLTEVQLRSYAKSTGGKGLHVVVAMQPEHDWPVIKQFAHAVVSKIEKNDPRLYTTNMAKAARRNRIYLDYLRNDQGSTAIATFSTRARPGVPVAVPLDWKELEASIRPLFHVWDFSEWRKRLRRDPWKGMLASQRLTAEMLAAYGLEFSR